MVKVITYGTFDLFHIGHLNILKKAKAQGDYLIVCLSTDKFNEIGKNKKTVISYDDRKAILEAIKYVDLVIPEDNWEQKIVDIKEFRINKFVMGNDWAGKFDFLKEFCEVIYLPRTENISSTDLKLHIKNVGNIQYKRAGSCN